MTPIKSLPFRMLRRRRRNVRRGSWVRVYLLGVLKPSSKERFLVIRPVAACLLSCLLMSCAEPSSPTPLPPSVCSDLLPEPILPDTAGIVQPATEEEREATRDFLTWAASVVDWGRQGWSRAETAKGLC